jgi:hypothetical protein
MLNATSACPRENSGRTASFLPELYEGDRFQFDSSGSNFDPARDVRLPGSAPAQSGSVHAA